MAYDVSSSIGELLYENNSVIIPNFGGFMLSYRSASINHVQATLTPPSKSPSFNPNLKVNDGILINYIKNQNHMTLEQAKKAVADHIENFNSLFEKKEMIDIPKVGRLYKDYVGDIKFLPHQTNFNTNAFGLPEIKFHPIQRNVVQEEVPNATQATVAQHEDVAATPSANIADTVTTNAPVHDLPQEESISSMAVDESNRFGWARKVMPFLIAASLALVAVSFYFLQKDPHPADMESAQIVPITDMDRLNTKPTLTSEEIPIEEEKNQYIGPTTGLDDSEEYSSISSNDYDVVDDSNSGYYSGDNECIIIVGQFGVSANAKKFRRQLERDGYETYSGKNEDKGLNMVGVKFNYDSSGEKRKMLTKLQEQYTFAAWIYKD